MQTQSRADALIAKWIVEHSGKMGDPSEVVIADYHVSVWAVIGQWERNRDIEEARDAYDLPLEAAEAALAFYNRYPAIIDVRRMQNGIEDREMRAMLVKGPRPANAENDDGLRASGADVGRAFLAPDGIEILPFDLPGLAHLSFVEGRIPPRPEPYPVHMHGALEQVTYVLAGRVTVETWDAAAGRVARFVAGPGEAFVTLPAQTLSYANAGPETARVLFICAPAYPPDDGDTRLVDAHRAPTAEDRAWSLARHHAAVAAFAGIVGGRVRALTPTDPPSE